MTASPQSTGADTKRRDIVWSAILLVVAVLWTLAAVNGPIQWSDCGSFISLAATSGWFAEHFAATAHPLFHLLSVTTFRVTGVEGLVYLNALLMVPVAMLSYQLARVLGARQAAALFAAAAAILPHNVVWISTKVEVYVLNELLVLAALWLALRPSAARQPTARLFCIGVLTGMAASVHQLTFVVLLPLYIHLLARYRFGIVWTLPGFLVGMFACYPGLLNDIRQGLSLMDIGRSYLTGAMAGFNGWGSDLFRFDRMLDGRMYVAVTLLSVCGLGLFGLLPPRDNANARVLWWAALLNLLFAISYDVSDRFTFFLPGASLFAILGALAFDRLLQAKVAARWSGPLRFTAAVAPGFGLAMLVLLAGRLSLPFAQPDPNDLHRNSAIYFLVPWLGDRSAEAFVAEYREVAPPGTSVLADWMPGGALLSAQAAGVFPDRHIEDCTEFEPKRAQVDTRGMLLVRLKYCEYIDDKPLVPIAIGYRIDG